MAVVMDLQHVVKIYRMGGEKLHALDDVSLSVAEGEFLAVMGASGSGKSTLMNVMGCLDSPTSGSYRLVGQEVSQLSSEQLAKVRNRVLGFVFQGFNLLPRTTAAENVALPLVYAGVSKRERRSRAAEALAQVGLGGRIDHRPNQLSGGQQQRVAIARALVMHPKVILADEPTGNLDSRTSVEVVGVLQRLMEQGMTIVMVTHEPDIATFASRVVVMRDGRLISDTPQHAVPADASALARASIARLSAETAAPAGARP